MNLLDVDYGYITGWAAVLVLLFIVPLLVVFIEYLVRINKQLAILTTAAKKREDNSYRRTNLENPLPVAEGETSNKQFTNSNN